MKGVRCAPCGEFLVSDYLCPHFIADGDDILAHWVVLHRGQIDGMLDLCRGTVVGDEKMSFYYSMILFTCFCYVERSTTKSMDVATTFNSL
jgi:hypothetical protein